VKGREALDGGADGEGKVIKAAGMHMHELVVIFLRFLG